MMQAAFIIKDRNGKPYAVVGLLNGGTEFYPLSENAKSWSKWMSAEFATKKITKSELVQTLDNAMDVEGPKPYNRTSKPQIDELIKNVKPSAVEQEPKTKSLIPVGVSGILPTISIIDAQLSDLDNSEWRNAVNFKSAAFISDMNKSTFHYEVKRTRAVWDPSLSVPGTERRGGWRCPVGTRYGGQITDRFGRNCGWGVARRLGNALADLGERIEDRGDARMARRVERRNRRMVERLGREAGDAVSSASRAIDGADITEDIDTPKTPKGPGIVERAAGRIADILDEDNRAAKKEKKRRKRSAQREQRRQARQQLRGALGDVAAGVQAARGRDVAPADAPDADEEFIPMVPRPRTPVPPPRPKTPVPPPRPKPRTPKPPPRPEGRPPKPRTPRSPRPDGAWKKTDIDALDIIEMSDNELVEAWHQRRPYTPPEGRIGLDAATEARKRDQRRMLELEMNRRGIDKPAERDRPAPAAPIVDDVSKTPVPKGDPLPGESLQDYMDRKYNEHQKRVREIREAGGNAGFLKRDEWDAFHGPVVAKAWQDAQVRAGRDGRRRAGEDVGAEAASRRPGVDDVADTVQPSVKPKKPGAKKGARKKVKAPKKDRSYDDLAAEYRENWRQFYEIGDQLRVGEEDPELIKRRQEINRRRQELRNELMEKFPDKAEEFQKIDREEAVANMRPAAEPRRPSTPSAAPEEPKAPTPVTPPGKEKEPMSIIKRLVDKVFGDDDEGKKFVPTRFRKRKVSKLYGNVDKAIKHLHEDDGSLDDVPDDVVLEAILDDDLVSNTGPFGPKPLDFGRREIIEGGLVRQGLRQGSQFENKRFRFELVKEHADDFDIVWEVIKIEDKKTGETWYLKTSQYGNNDALLEGIGMRAAEALQFGNDENHVRLLELVERPDNDAAGDKPLRWLMMKDVGQWEHGGVKMVEPWKEAGKRGRLKPGEEIEERDAGRMIALDYVLANEDRHGGNFLLARDERGKVRIGAIDMGLIAGGRIGAGIYGELPDDDELRAAMASLGNQDVDGYRIWGQNDAIHGLRNAGYVHQPGSQRRARFKEQVKRSLDALEDQLDDIFSRERLEKNGVKLSERELLHLELAKEMARKRLANLRKSDQLEILAMQFDS